MPCRQGRFGGCAPSGRPIPGDPLAVRFARMPKLEDVVWFQEEPRNNGAWFFVEPLIEEALTASKREVTRPRYAGRIASELDAVSRPALDHDASTNALINRYRRLHGRA